MKGEFVLSLDGDVFTIGNGNQGAPNLQLALLRGSRTVIRAVIDEPLDAQERGEIIESFSCEVDARQGVVFSTTSSDTEMGDDVDSFLLPLPEGSYKVTLHTTIVGPCAPAKVGVGSICQYFRRTRPAQPYPSWLRPDAESDELWVGMIVHIERLEVASKRTAKSKVIYPGKNAKLPTICPPGIQSLEPEGWKRFIQIDMPDSYRLRDLAGFDYLTISA